LLIARHCDGAPGLAIPALSSDNRNKALTRSDPHTILRSLDGKL